MFRFGTQALVQDSARLFLLLTVLELLAAQGPAFLIYATSSMRGFMQLPGWLTLTVESVANCSASGISPLDSSATVRCPQV